MLENYDHYISKNIKAYYTRKLFSPAIYLILLLLFWNIFSLSDLLFPTTLTSKDTLVGAHQNDVKYVTTTLTDLHFTGYTRTFLDNTTGYYYYTLQNDECFFVLLSPKTCEEGLPNITSISISAELIDDSTNFQLLLDNVAKDLGWTSSGIRSKVSPYYLSEPAFNAEGNTLLFLFILLT